MQGVDAIFRQAVGTFALAVSGADRGQSHPHAHNSKSDGEEGNDLSPPIISLQKTHQSPALTEARRIIQIPRNQVFLERQVSKKVRRSALYQQP
jgi:hypothetical protein